jgi:hypothetical protein
MVVMFGTSAPPEYILPLVMFKLPVLSVTFPLVTVKPAIVAVLLTTNVPVVVVPVVKMVVVVSWLARVKLPNVAEPLA